MKKIFYYLLVATLVFSCDDDDEVKLNELTVKITCGKTITNYSTFHVILTELKTNQKHEKFCDENGHATFNLPAGAYNIVAENLVNGVSTFYGRNENYTLSEKSAAIDINVENITKALDQTFVLDELYFNGAKNGKYNYTMYEQYFTIRNISDRPLYADGLCFGVAGDHSCVEAFNEMSVFLPDEIIISQFYTIPGNGTDHIIQPNKSLVIAFSAINHNENGDKPKSLDLSGADFEIYVEGGMTVDNPEVPNVFVDYSVFEAFHWQYSGTTPMILFQLDENHKTFIANSKVNLCNPASIGTRKHDFLKLPKNLIIDAVETGCKEEFYRKVLPASIDKSNILVDATMCESFKEQFVKRKETLNTNGEKVVMDTNDSAKDFIVDVGGQKNYPKK